MKRGNDSVDSVSTTTVTNYLFTDEGGVCWFVDLTYNRYGIMETYKMAVRTHVGVKVNWEKVINAKQYNEVQHWVCVHQGRVTSLIKGIINAE